MLIEGLQLPFGIQPVNPAPVDVWSGPYSSVNEALGSIPLAVRFQTMQVRIIDPIEGGTIYWFRDGIQDSDLVLFSFDYEEINNLKTGLTQEIINRVAADLDLQNQITGETASRIASDLILNDLITGETASRIATDLALNDLITGETASRIATDLDLQNQITGETASRIATDLDLQNQITGLTSSLSTHINDYTLHLTSQQNTLLDGISGITFIEINYLSGLNDNVQTQLNSKSNIGHKHSELYQPDGTNPFVYTDNGGTLHIDGNITQSGSAYETHAEQVYTKDNLIILRDGAVAGLADGEYAGFTAKLYDGVNDGQLVFDKDGWARVGDVGLLQKIATIEETTTDGYLMQYNAATKRLEGTSASGLNVSYALTAGDSDTLDGQHGTYYATASSLGNYLPLVGGTLTGSLTAPSFIKNDGTSSQFLKADGSVDSNTYVVTSRAVSAGSGLIGGGNLSADITLSHADTSDVINLFSTGNTGGVVLQNISLTYDGFGHTTLSSVQTYDLDNRYYTETESDSRFVNVTGGTINGDVNVVSGVISGDGQGLYNIPASGVTGLQLDRIVSGDNSAIISSSGLIINTDTTIESNFILPHSVHVAGGSTLGIIYKNSDPFIHDFNYGNNGSLITDGFNTFIGGAGNFTMGSTAVNSYEASYNIGIGDGVLTSNTTGWANIGIGSSALLSNTTGYYNFGIGPNSLATNTSGIYNLGFGGGSLEKNTIGSYNNAFGISSLNKNTSGERNVGVGTWSLYSNTTGSYNTAIGISSLYHNSTTSNNTAIGYYSGRLSSTGQQNTSSSNSIFIGYDVRPYANGDINEIVIGYLANGSGSNTTTIGNTDVTKTQLRGEVVGSTFTSTVAIGTSPLNITSNTLVANLNADLLDGHHQDYFVNTNRTVSAGAGLTGGGSLSGDITISHYDISSVSDISSDNSNGTVIQDLALNFDIFGHVSGATIGTYDLDNRYYTETESDSRFVDVTGDTINGNLNIVSTSSESNVLNVVGVGNNTLLSITDTDSSSILDVQNTNGVSIVKIDNDGTLRNQTVSLTNISSSPYTVLSIDKTKCRALYFDYLVYDTSTNAQRNGIIMVTQDGTNLKYTDTSTPDLNASTTGIEFTPQIMGANVLLVANITSGSWSVNVGTRIL